jgi:hypothetical protein
LIVWEELLSTNKDTRAITGAISEKTDSLASIRFLPETATITENLNRLTTEGDMDSKISDLVRVTILNLSVGTFDDQ